MNRNELLEHLKEGSRVLRDPFIEEAFKTVDRKDFVLPDYEPESYEDYPLPIGFDQTISQPTTVAFMLELLGAKRGDTVLDIGSGSGYTTALLASIVGSRGSVIGVEIIPELAAQGRERLGKYGFKHADIKLGGEKLGTGEQEVYDRILASAQARDIPKELLKNLKIGGVLVLPVGGAVTRVEKTSADSFAVRSYPGFTFVPLRY